MNESPKLFIDSQIHGRPQKQFFSRKTLGKSRLSGLEPGKQPASMGGEEPKVKYFGGKEIPGRRKSSKLLQNLRAEEIRRLSIDSEFKKPNSSPKPGDEGSQSSSFDRRSNQAQGGLRFRKKSFGSTASLGRKILIKSRFSPTKPRKESTTKQI